MTLSPNIQPDDPGHKISQNSLFQHEIPDVSKVEGSISEELFDCAINICFVNSVLSLFNKV